MTPELTALALSGLLHAALYVAFAVPANLELTPAWTSSPRDRPPPRPMSVKTARLHRALTNSFEALTCFTLAVIVVTLGQQSTTLTQTCAWIFLGARAAYIPAYWLGWAPWRSAIWAVGFLATLTMILAALL